MYHYIRDIVSTKQVNLSHISIKYEIADFLTKILPYPRYTDIKEIANIQKIAE